MSLQKYRAKRDFSRTPEPRGAVGIAQDGKPVEKLSFVVQKHRARNLHYDFRLELGGTLKSWAIPKGPSLDPADKRLAIHVEDHPIEYGSFEGQIPEHQYGAGSVSVWDCGTWMPDGDPEEGLKKGRLKFQLNGHKLSGGWALVRIRSAFGVKDNWLLIKEKDKYSRTGEEANITELQPDSVIGIKTKKTERPKAAAISLPRASVAIPKKAPKPGRQSGAGSDLLSHPGRNGMPEQARKAGMPAFIKPQLATLADAAPAGGDWLSEIKFDGYRALCRLENGNASMFSRSGRDWTGKWRVIAAAAAQLPAQTSWLDGEVVAIDNDGRVDFQLLQNMAGDQADGRLAYYVFDLPYFDGYDLRNAPLRQRKKLLADLLCDAAPGGPLFFSDHFAGQANEAFSHACMHGLEGIMVKRADAPYESGRSRSWLKLKCSLRQEFVIGGYTDPAGSREKFGALLVGVHDDAGRLRYAGRIGTGFDASLLQSIAERFAGLASKQTPFADPPKGREAAGVHWLKPELIAEATFAQWTARKLIRHASFVGLRTDKPASEIQREAATPVREIEDDTPDGRSGVEPTSAGGARKSSARTSPKTSMPPVTEAGTASRDGGGVTGQKATKVAGVTLTHPAKVLYADLGLSKLMLAQYYERIADWILPHLAQRPLTLVRCPQGSEHQCFFQRHANQATVSGIDRIEVRHGAARVDYLMANSTQALVSLVQMGVLELHTWGARQGHLEQPDRIIFDLDPAPDVAWIAVIEAAQLVKGLLDEIGLASFVKTTGGKGLHVVIPLKPERAWGDITAFSRAFAEHLARVLPDRFTAKMSKSARGGKIFVDYLRNAAEATAIAAYSPRARPGAPVSTPLAWNELDADLRSDGFNVLTVGERLQGLKQDPWQEYYTMNQRISPKALRAFETEERKHD